MYELDLNKLIQEVPCNLEYTSTCDSYVLCSNISSSLLTAAAAVASCSHCSSVFSEMQNFRQIKHMHFLYKMLVLIVCHIYLAYCI
jgi:hypothetical protein